MEHYIYFPTGSRAANEEAQRERERERVDEGDARISSGLKV